MTETSTKYNRYAARIPKGMGVVGSQSFDVQGGWGLDQFRPIRKDRKRREMGGGGGGGGWFGVLNWTFFMDAINVWFLRIV